MVTLQHVVGHETVKAALRRAFAADRLHHAYLFAGPDGVGKRALGFALAALVNCEAPVGAADSLDACGACNSCLKMAGSGHPDVHEVAPDGRDIKIAQVREIHAATRFRPYEGKRRVFVIDQAHTMRVEAANALLKTLEEPRGDTMFVLVTPQPHRLLTTVISRCQPMRFGPLAPGEIAAVLERVAPELRDDEALARLAGGSIGRAQALAESPVFAERHTLIERFTTLDEAGVGAALGWADELSRDRDNLPEVLELFRSVLRDAVLRSSGASTERLLHVDRAGAVARLAAGRQTSALLALSERVDETERLLLGNVNARMALEQLLLLAAAPATARTA